MNDARCELAHHQIAQLLLPCFYQSDHRSDVRSSAMIFQLEPRVGQHASSAKLVVLIARFNTEVYAWSNSIPASLINLPASIACCVPFQKDLHQPNQ